MRPHDKRKLDDYVPELRAQRTEGLELDRAGITADDLESLRELTELNWLSLKSCASVTDDGLLHLAALERLETLDLTGTRPTGPGLRGLSRLERLWQLDLSRQMHLRDEGLAHLPPNLNRIDLRQSKRLTDAGVAHLAGMRGLERLILDGCARITNESIRVVSCLPSIQELSVRNCPKISREALDHLANAPSIRAVDFGFTSVTAEDLKEFGRARPACQLEWEHTA